MPSRIPRLKAAVDHLLTTCLAALAQLPARPDMDSAAELVQLLFRFCEAVRHTVDGTRDDDKTFVHRSRAFYRALRASVRATAPDFRPFEDPGEYFRPGEPRSQQREDELSGSVLGGADVCATPLEPSESGSDVADQLEEDVSMPVMGLLDVRQVIKE